MVVVVLVVLFCWGSRAIATDSFFFFSFFLLSFFFLLFFLLLLLLFQDNLLMKENQANVKIVQSQNVVWFNGQDGILKKPTQLSLLSVVQAIILMLCRYSLICLFGVVVCCLLFVVVVVCLLLAATGIMAAGYSSSSSQAHCFFPLLSSLLFSSLFLSSLFSPLLFSLLSLFSLSSLSQDMSLYSIASSLKVVLSFALPIQNILPSKFIQELIMLMSNDDFQPKEYDDVSCLLPFSFMF